MPYSIRVRGGDFRGIDKEVLVTDLHFSMRTCTSPDVGG
jgi:hypothetical protein